MQCALIVISPIFPTQLQYRLLRFKKKKKKEERERRERIYMQSTRIYSQEYKFVWGTMIVHSELKL